MEVELHPTAYLKCGRCGGTVDVLTRPGSEVTFARALRGALFLPVGLAGLLLVLALAAAASELDVLTAPARGFALLGWSLVAWLVGVAILRATAEGGTTLRGVSASLWTELLRPALLAATLTVPAVLVPRTGWRGAILLALAAPVLVSMLLGVFALAPLQEALGPLGAARRLWRLGTDGALAVGCIAGLWLFARMLGGLAEAPATEVPPLWAKTLGALGALSLFLVPRVLGLLVEARGEALGYRFHRRGVVPVLPGARAEQRVGYQPPPPPPRASTQPIALDDAPGLLELESLTPTGRSKE